MLKNRLRVAGFSRWLWLLALLSLGGCSGGCTEGTKSPPGPPVAPPDTLRLHLPAPVRSANPLTFDYSHERWIIQYTHAGLYILDKETSKVEPELATALPTTSDDKRIWTIHLRRDARWHDGEPVTALDVEESFKALQNPEVDAGRLRDVFSLLKSVKALEDGFTLQLTYSEPHAFTLLSLLDLPVVPAHVLKTLTPEELNDRPSLPGSGPFKLVKHTGESVVLERNDDWFGAGSKLRSIEWITIPDGNAAMSELKRGEIDAMGVSYSQWRQDLSKDPAVIAGFHQLRYHRPSYRFFGWNCERSLFRDKNVRKALALAFDVEKYLKDNFYEGSRRVTGPFFFNSPQYNHAVKPLPYDPAAAVELLKKAGWNDSDDDGILDRDGEKFAFTVIFSSALPEGETRAAALRDACKELGIRVELRRLDNAAFEEVVTEGEFDCVAFGLGTPDPEIDPYQIFHSDSIGDRGSNFYRFRNEEADELMEKARIEFDDPERNALYHRLHEIIHEEQPFLFLFEPEYLLLVNKRLRNVKSFDLGLTPRIGIEWWTEPEPEPQDGQK